MKKEDVTIGSLCTGTGMADYGYTKVCGTVKFGVDLDSNACYVHDLNFPDVPIIRGIIGEITAQEILDIAGLKKGKLKVLHSSPPCQGSSTSNTSTRWIDNPDNKIFVECIKLQCGIKPTIAIYENVVGLIRGEGIKGEIATDIRMHYHHILREIDLAGYDSTTWKLRASDYGSPQARERIWIICVDKTLGVKMPLKPPKRKPGFIGIHDVLNDVLGFEHGHSFVFLYSNPRRFSCLPYAAV
jgi:DNA (cytosine-5)-methyltransferase 1